MTTHADLDGGLTVRVDKYCIFISQENPSGSVDTVMIARSQGPKLYRWLEAQGLNQPADPNSIPIVTGEPS